MKTWMELRDVSDKFDETKDFKYCQELLDINNHPLNAKIGIVFTCHMGHMPFMKYALQQYRKINDALIVGSYDAREVQETDEMMWKLPFPDIHLLAHMWVYKHQTWQGMAKRHGWIWDEIYAAGVLRQFKNIQYVFTVNGDCVWEKPEGIYEIIELLGDDDFMSGQSENDFFHTCSMVFKRDAYFHFIDYMIEVLPTSDCASFSPEMLVRDWQAKYNIKFKHAPIQPTYQSGQYAGMQDTYCETDSPSTWRDVLGFRNMVSEIKYANTERLEPPPKEYIDLRKPQMYWSDHLKNTLCNYYKTGDRRYLYMFWDQDPDKWPEDRVYKKLEEYSPEPIYKENN